jgi:hypothetical protein
MIGVTYRSPNDPSVGMVIAKYAIMATAAPISETPAIATSLSISLRGSLSPSHLFRTILGCDCRKGLYK